MSIMDRAAETTVVVAPADKAAQAEREAVVAWLRAKTTGEWTGRWYAHEYADDIEQGTHMADTNVDERTAVLAWLRAKSGPWSGIWYAQEYADDIEKGAHLK